MDSTFTDQVAKLDVRSLMARVLRVARAETYDVRLPMKNWPSAEARPDGHLLQIEIVLQRAEDVPANMPRAGDMLLKFTLPDGQQREQMIFLVGVPATKASWRWKAICPFSGEHVQMLYFKCSLEQFVSRKVAGLKYRPTLSRAGYRHLDRRQLYLRELGAVNPDPFIPKQIWMTQERYEELLRLVMKEDIRWMSKALGIPAMDFYDEYEEVDVSARPELLPLDYPQSRSMSFQDKQGTVQIKAKFKQKYGLPDGAITDAVARACWLVFSKGIAAAN